MRKHVPAALAATALLFAMTGGAFAAGHYLITSANQIKPSVLSGLHGERGSRGLRGISGGPGPPGPPGPPAAKLWAAITNTGTLAGSNGVTAVTSTYPTEPASYEITFDQKISQCAALGTVAPVYTNGAQSGEIAIEAGTNNAGTSSPDSLDVFTYGATGTPGFRGFSVAVYC